MKRKLLLFLFATIGIVGYTQAQCVDTVLNVTDQLNETSGTKLGRTFRDGNAPISCGTTKPCPGSISTETNYFYKTYRVINNTSQTRCYTVNQWSENEATYSFSAAYLNSYSPLPADACVNYLADMGGSTVTSGDRLYSFNLLAGDTAIILVESVFSEGLNNFNLIVTTELENALVVASDQDLGCAPQRFNLPNAINSGATTPGLTFTYFNSSWTQLTGNNRRVTDSGMYYIVGTHPDYCNDTAEVLVSINEKPVVITQNPAALCLPATIDLTSPAIVAGSSASITNYSYWQNAAATVPAVNPAAVTHTGSKLFYIVGTTAFACKDTTNVLVRFNAKPDVVTYNPPAACAPATINLTAPILRYGTTPNLTLSYHNSDYTPLVNPNAVTIAGNYYLVGTNSGGCSDTGMFFVSIYPCDMVLGAKDENGNKGTDKSTENGVLSSIGNQNTVLKLYPNPANQILNFECEVNNAIVVDYNITDLTGRVLKQAHYNASSAGLHKFSVDISSLVPGMYYFNFGTSKQGVAKSIKFVVSK